MVKMIPLLDVNWQGLPLSSSLGYRDSDIVSFLEKEDLTAFTFDGLKRRLGLHSETLSRALSRLEQEGIIRKTLDGYRVNPKISKLKFYPPRTEEPCTPLLQTYLPSTMMTQQLVTQLKGKWFGFLRWLGISENSEGITLKWVTEDGSLQINANIQGSVLNIEAKFLTNNNLDLALKTAYQLMAYINRQYTGTGIVRNVAYYGDSNPYSHLYFTLT
jgi:DNA-binding Lrp family transcriptional regulator